MTTLSQAVQETLVQTLEKTKRLVTQTASRKAVDNRAKLYSWHAPEVECIGKGKSRNPYEFGVKVGLAMTLRGNLIVGARSFPGNPYDGHTMHEQIEQSAILMQGLGVKPEVVYADLGYRGVDKENPQIEIKHRGKDKRLTDEERRLLKRRQAIEPIIGHLKTDHRMDRCHLKGSEGDALHGVLCAAGYNIRWLLRMITKKGLGLLLCLLQASGLAVLFKKLAEILGCNRLQNSDQRWGWLEMDFAGATNSSGDLFVVDSGLAVIFKIKSDKTISVFAGTEAVYTYTNTATDGGVGVGILCYIMGLVIDNQDNLYVSDRAYGYRKIDTNGVISTPYTTYIENMSELAIDEFKNIYMTGVVNVNSVVKYSPSGKIDVLAGVIGSAAYADGNNAEVRFTRDLNGIVIDSMGNILVSDRASNAIRKVIPIAP